MGGWRKAGGGCERGKVVRGAVKLMAPEGEPKKFEGSGRGGRPDEYC